MLLRRGSSKDGLYIKSRDGFYDHQLFSLCWVPVVTALSYVFDKAGESAVSLKAMQGFTYVSEELFNQFIWEVRFRE